MPDEPAWTLDRCCIAFGDGDNDRGMLRAAAKGCVMANANELLKVAVPDLETIRSNREDGVAHKVQHVFGLRVS